MRKIFIGSIMIWGLFAFAQEFPLLHNFKPVLVDTTVPSERVGTGTVLFTTMNGLADQINSAASQRTSDFGPPGCTSGNCYQSVAADDFVIPNTVTNWIIDSVEVVGTYDGADGFPEAGPAESVNVYIMNNDVVNSLPDDTDLASAALFAYEDIGYTDGNSGDFFIDLSGTLTGSADLTPGTYWIIVQANMDFEPGGREQQWGWAESSLNPDTGSTIGFESAFFQNFAVLGASCVGAWGRRISDCGITNTDDPTAVEPDLAFELRGSELVPGITVNPTSGLETSEGGATATFTVVLDAEPAADVTIGVSSSDTTLGTVSVGTLTFTSVNWNVAQTVTITGQDDTPPTDGDRPYTVLLAAATSADGDYNGMDADDVSVTNLDNDIPGIQVLPISGLATGENGTNTTFAINATTAPAADVVVPLSSSDTSEVTVPASVTLPAGSTAAVTVTVTAVNDAIQDGDQSFSIVTGDPTSGDGTYDALDGEDVADASGTNADNDGDTAGISITETDGGPLGEPLTTGEPNLTDDFGVVLTSEPTADVILTMASSDNTEASVSPSTLTFTSANWNVRQTVTVNGLDDAIADGNVAYSIITNPASSGDGNYDNLDPANISAVNNDDGDQVGVTVTPSAIPLVTDEAGTLAPTFTVVLDSEPAANVTISVASGDASEGSPDTASLTFTAANWDTAQIVTVNGVNDQADDDDVSYAILLGSTVSTDPTYNGVDVDDVSCLNIDDADTSGITVTPSESPLTTDEEQTLTPFFDVVLISEPIADVTVGVSSSDTGEGTVSTSSLIFTSANWDTPQTVTVTGVNDDIDDGVVLYQIRFADAVSTDPAYSGFVLDDLAARNLDDDTANVIVTPSGGLPVNISEDGLETDVLTVSLSIPPTDDVVVTIESSDTTEGIVSTSLIQLTFTTANWDTPQSANVQGVDDMVDDGDILFAYTVDVTSADGAYDAVVVAPLQAINADNDEVGITVTAPAELSTTEGGGTDSFTLVLESQPVSNVDIQIESSDITEVTVSSAEVTFTSKNWNVPQTVTVTGQDDAVQDGNQSYTVTVGPVSGDPLYAAIDPADLAGSNVDDETADIVVNPTSGLVTTEDGPGSASFTVVLSSMPTSDVTVTLGSDDSSEGTTDVGSLTFTNANWDTAQTVTVTGADDVLQDGDVAYNVVLDPATSTDVNYSGFDPNDVSVTNVDNDTASVIITAAEPLSTSETGGSDSFTVRLGSSPSADVTITVSSNDTTEGTAASAVATLTFTDANWDTEQTVTVTGVDDSIVDGTVGYAFGFSVTSGDGNYNGLPVSDLSAENADDDVAGIVVTAAGGVEPLVVRENDLDSSFSLVLESEPSADVTIGVSSSDITEATLSVASVTFTSANWNVPQTILVSNVDDAVVDGTVAFSLVTAAATSGDANYNGLNPRDLSAACEDDDFAGILATSSDGFPVVTSEAGKSDSFTVVLTSQPTGTVTMPVAHSDATEGTVSPSSLTFTTSDWNVPQVVTVTGVDDDEARADGSVSFTITMGPSSSSDSEYNDLTREVSGINEDDSNDIVGISVTPNNTPLDTSEAGGSDTFTVVLTSQPSANVEVEFESDNSDEGEASPESLTFTSANWNVPQTVTVTGQDDATEDGDISYNIVSGPAVSDDGNYNGLNPVDVAAVNRDNDGSIQGEDYDVAAEVGGPVIVNGPDASVGVYAFNPDTGEWDFVGNVTIVDGVGISDGSFGSDVFDAEPDTVYAIGDPNNGSVPTVPGVTTVPTLGEWGMIFFILLLMAVALTHMRRQRLA